MLIAVGARTSPLSQAQVKEVLCELRQHHPHVDFDPKLLPSRGDKDLQTSLRTLGKTDFFTKEIDELLLEDGCRIAIHSAKDLPEPLPKGICMVALTKGLDPSDSLVMRPGMTLASLPPGAIIATSSERRENCVKELRRDLRFCDLRGNIGQRISKLDTGEADGVVVAEAALLRLGLSHLNRLRLPGVTTYLQGQLALLAREGDLEMQTLLRCLDTRKKTLYLGLDAPEIDYQVDLHHYPVIKIVPRPLKNPDLQHAFRNLKSYTHLLFTSKNSATLFFDYLQRSGYSHDIMQDKHLFAVGQATAEVLHLLGGKNIQTAEREQAEGLIEVLENCDLTRGHVFWPHSALSRPVLKDYLSKRGVQHYACAIYDTMLQKIEPVPSIETFDEIVFTSPSTVQGFLAIYGALPKEKSLKAIGPITQAALDKLT